jgi:hypothetical protein
MTRDTYAELIDEDLDCTNPVELWGIETPDLLDAKEST